MPKPGTTPKALLWDVGNVILRWDPNTLYRKIFPDPAERARFLAQGVIVRAPLF